MRIVRARYIILTIILCVTNMFGMEVSQVVPAPDQPEVVNIEQEEIAQKLPIPVASSTSESEHIAAKTEAAVQEETKDPYKDLRTQRSQSQQIGGDRKKLDDQAEDLEEELKAGTKKISDIVDYIQAHTKDPLLKDFVLRILLLSTVLSQDQKVDIAKLMLEKGLFTGDERKAFQYIYEMLIARYDRAQDQASFDQAATALMEGAVLSNFYDTPFPFKLVAELLLQASKATIDRIGENNGMTLLISIAKRCDDIAKSLEKAQLLIGFGANLNNMDKADKTALDWAQDNGCKQLVELLKAFGALTAEEVEKSKEQDSDTPLTMNQESFVIMPEQDEEVD